MAVRFSTIPGTTLSFCSISGASYLAWLQHGCELFKHLWNTYPAWLSAFQASLDILHGCELFNHLWTVPAWLSALQTSLGHPTLHGCQLFNHLWNKLSYMTNSL